ncbi:hypothetical protein JHD50_08360 [Sulfurimonas sp. MAG313]|nr:hypothetical protein [Sulfurimonas sp. MAG313]MDF1881312.1 hypothetical protein [Sulfurimonas sp. MAG313]
MIIIFCAFEVEARALVDKYKLSKKEDDEYKTFYNEDTLILISGMGQDNAQKASEYFLLNYSHSQKDIFINLGICAAHTIYKVGDIVQIKKLANEEESHLLKTANSSIKKVSCFSTKVPVSCPVNEDIAEMEAMSLYLALSPYFPKENMSFLKVVSDNFDCAKPNKDFIISLFNNQFNEIDTHIKHLIKGLV